jgi:RimJ/RimL family protein N-acetyltransferase
VTPSRDWPSPAPRLTGAIVTLEPLRPEHEEPLFAVAGDDEVWRWIRGRAPTRAEFAALVADALAAQAANTEQPFVTVLNATGRPIGSSRYLTIRPEHRGVEIGHTWLTREAWRTGANLEAKLLMLGHAFETLGAARVEFKTDARNVRSRDALAALPARFEGVLRRHMQTPYGPRDSAYYGVIAEEWPGVRANLLRRLGRPVGDAPRRTS